MSYTFALDTLPTPMQASPNYVPVVQSGNLLYVSGQLPFRDGKVQYVGKVGKDYTVEEARAAAVLCAENVLAQVLAFTGDLKNVTRCVRVGGFVNGIDDFAEQPKVIDAASEVFNVVFGHLLEPRHARAAVGVNGLPLGVPVEVEAVFEVS